MFRDEIINLFRETTPDWMDHAHSAHEQDDELQESNPVEWDDPIEDGSLPPSVSEELALQESDSGEGDFGPPGGQLAEEELINFLQDRGFAVGNTDYGVPSSGGPAASPGSSAGDSIAGGVGEGGNILTGDTGFSGGVGEGGNILTGVSSSDG